MTSVQIKRVLYAGMLFTCLAACSSGPDKLGKLDLKKWRSDRNGCKNVRAGLANDFKSEQKQLLGKFIDEVGEILGRPDIHQLGERNTKFYVYFLEKGTQCEDITKIGCKKGNPEIQRRGAVIGNYVSGSGIVGFTLDELTQISGGNDQRVVS